MLRPSAIRPPSKRPHRSEGPTRPSDERPASLTDEIAIEVWADEAASVREEADEENGA